MLLAFCVFAYTEAGQLLKLPILIIHYNEHNAGDHHLPVWKYIVDHYKDTDQVPADHDRDMQLPFKTSHFFQSNILLFAPEASYTFIQVIKDPVVNFPLINERCHAATFAGTIFQPPRA